MADLYYGYAERNASDEINWAEIGKNVTDMLKQETAIREQKKAAIDAGTRRDGEILANAPQGEHQGMNQWALTYADNAQQARLMQDRLLRSGQLKPKDYFIMRQNLNDGTKEAFNLIKEYQSEYKSRMESFQKKETSLFDVDLLAEVEGFGNFNESELYINPTNFEVNIAKKKKEIIDGKEVYVMSKDPNDFTTVNAMRNRIKGKFNRLDVAKTLQGGVSVLGKDMNSLVEQIANTGRGGLIKSIKDITQRPDFGAEVNNSISLFERAESTYLDSILSVPDDTMSILYDYVGQDPKNKKQYTYTWNDKEAGGNVILLKNSPSGRPVPQFTDEQKEVAKNALREKFRIMLDREIELKATPQVQLQEPRALTPAELTRQGEKATAENVAQNIIYSLTGDQNDANAGTSYLASIYGSDFNKTKEGYTVIDENGRPQTYKFKADGKVTDPFKFAKSLIGPIAKNAGIREKDVLRELERLLPKGARINTTTEARGFEEDVNAPSKAVKAEITTDLFTISSEKSAKILQKIVPKGFIVTDIGKGIFNDVQVTAPNGDLYYYNSNMEPSEVEAEKKLLQAFIEENSVTSGTTPASKQTTIKGGRER